MFTAYGHFIVLKSDKGPETTSSGLFIPATAAHRHDGEEVQSGTLLSKGDKVEHLNVGDLVYIRRKSGRIDDDHFVAHCDDVVCVKKEG